MESFWMLTTGIVAALLAAPFGLVDWIAVPSGTRAKRIGLLHGGGNGVVVTSLGLAGSFVAAARNIQVGCPFS